MKKPKISFSNAFNLFFHPTLFKGLVAIVITCIIILAAIRGHYGYGDTTTMFGQVAFILYYPIILLLENIPFYSFPITFDVFIVSLICYYLIACIVEYLARKISGMLKV